MHRKIAALGLICLLVLTGATVATALTAANTLPPIRLGLVSIPVTPDSLKPVQCAAFTPENSIIAGNGRTNGTGGDDLMFGGASGSQRIFGLGGEDCIVGGTATNAIDGGAGDDICIAYAATTVNCETVHRK